MRFALLSLVLLLTSCGNSEREPFKLDLEVKYQINSNDLIESEQETKNDLLEALTPPSPPALFSNINCVGIFVRYDNTPDLNPNNCTIESALAPPINFNRIGGLSYSASGTFSVSVKEVDVSKVLRLFVIGFEVTNSVYCPNFEVTSIDSFSPNTVFVSKPVIMTRTFVVEPPYPDTISIPDFTGSDTVQSNTVIDNCNGPSFGGDL